MFEALKKGPKFFFQYLFFYQVRVLKKFFQKRGQSFLQLQNSIFTNFRNITLRNKLFGLSKWENEHKNRLELPTELADPSFFTFLMTGKPFLGSRRSKNEVLASKMLKIVIFSTIQLKMGIKTAQNHLQSRQTPVFQHF